MQVGNGAFYVTQNVPPAGAPFPADSAENGLSVDPGTGRIVLGNDLLGAAGLAQLLSDREIWMETFFLRLLTESGFNPEGTGSVFLDSRAATAWGFNFGTPKLGVEGVTMTKRAASVFSVGPIAVDGQIDNFGIFRGEIPPP